MKNIETGNVVLRMSITKSTLGKYMLIKPKFDVVIENLELQLSNVSLKQSDSHQCNVCCGGFKSKGYLDQHLAKKHDTALKPHKCDECDKILQSKRNLTEHTKKVHRSCKALIDLIKVPKK